MVKYTIEQIIDAGRRTYGKYGEDFRMSDVAKELNTKASSLYRHVATKRELYFAILTQEFKDFEGVVTELVQQLENPQPNSIIKEVGRYILKMAREDPERFKLMFLTKPPEQGAKLSDSVNETGHYENSCNPQTIGFMQNLILQHLKLHNIEVDNPAYITFYLISLVVGAGIATSPTYEYSNQGLLPKDQYEQFHEFVIENSMKVWE